MKKVICINDNRGHITKGKKYSALINTNEDYKIINDIGSTSVMPKHLFKEVKEIENKPEVEEQEIEFDFSSKSVIAFIGLHTSISIMATTQASDSYWILMTLVWTVLFGVWTLKI